MNVFTILLALDLIFLDLEITSNRHILIDLSAEEEGSYDKVSTWLLLETSLAFSVGYISASSRNLEKSACNCAIEFSLVDKST